MPILMQWLLIGGTVFLVAVALIFHKQLATLFLIVIARPYERDLGASAEGTILVAGDSTAYGTGTFNSFASIAGQLGSDFPHYTIRTISKNGATTEDLEVLLRATDLLPSYSFIVLQIGANDILQNRALVDIEEDLRGLLRFSRERSPHVFLMTAGNVGAARAFVRNSAPNPILEARTRAVRNLFLRVAEEEQAVYVDLFEEPATDVFLKEPKQYLAFDGLHPSAHGYMLWYRKLIEHIALYIKAPLRNGF